MEPTNKNSVKVEQSAANTTIHVQMPEEKAGFFRRVWSVVKGIFSYIGHFFATQFHLKTTKKVEDIQADHPVQGKTAATSDKVDDKAKTVPPLNSGTQKTETPPPAPKKEDAPPPPAKTVPPLNTGTQKTETPPPAPSSRNQFDMFEYLSKLQPLPVLPPPRLIISNPGKDWSIRLEEFDQFPWETGFPLLRLAGPRRTIVIITNEYELENNYFTPKKLPKNAILPDYAQNCGILLKPHFSGDKCSWKMDWDKLDPEDGEFYELTELEYLA